MQMKVSDGIVTLRALSAPEAQVIKQWPWMRYNRRDKTYEFDLSMEALDRLRGLLTSEGKCLPPSVEAERQRLHRIQAAVDAERIRESPEPLVRYPVKKKLYEHQVRAANMALLVFGIITPEEAAGHGKR